MTAHPDVSWRRMGDAMARLYERVGDEGRDDLLMVLDVVETETNTIGALRNALRRAANDGRNVLPDATDDQAARIEAWAQEVLG